MLFALKTLACEFEGSAVFRNGPYNVRRYPTRDRRLDLKCDLYGRPHEAGQVRDDFFCNTARIPPHTSGIQGHCPMKAFR